MHDARPRAICRCEPCLWGCPPFHLFAHHPGDEYDRQAENALLRRNGSGTKYLARPEEAGDRRAYCSTRGMALGRPAETRIVADTDGHTGKVFLHSLHDRMVSRTR